MTQPVFVGVDVAKHWLDIHHPVSGARRIENAIEAMRAFATQCVKQNAWIIFEASGGYDSRLRDTLEAAEVPSSRINLRQARDVARAMGVISKTDRVDARMLAELGTRLTPARTTPLSAVRRDCRPWQRVADSSGCPWLGGEAVAYHGR